VFRELWSWATIEMTKGGPLDLISASDRGMCRSRSTVGRTPRANLRSFWGG